MDIRLILLQNHDKPTYGERERGMQPISLSEEKKARIVRSLMDPDRRLKPNREGSFLNFTKKTYHGCSPFIPTQKMLDYAKGKFD